MRVEFTDIDEMAAELALRSESIVDGIIRFRIDYSPEQKENISQSVGVWVTAVVRSEGGDFIAEFGQMCGSDGPGDNTGGTDFALALKSTIQEVCSERDLILAGGKIEQF